jgi:hypothetical protein
MSGHSVALKVRVHRRMSVDTTFAFSKRCQMSYAMPPYVTALQPHWGHARGGVEVVVKGRRLGVGRDDIVRVTCGAIEWEVIAWDKLPLELTCRTAPMLLINIVEAAVLSFDVLVSTRTGDGHGVSRVKFTYVVHVEAEPAMAGVLVAHAVVPVLVPLDSIILSAAWRCAVCGFDNTAAPPSRLPVFCSMCETRKPAPNSAPPAAVVAGSGSSPDPARSFPLASPAPGAAREESSPPLIVNDMSADTALAKYDDRFGVKRQALTAMVSTVIDENHLIIGCSVDPNNNAEHTLNHLKHCFTSVPLLPTPAASTAITVDNSYVVYVDNIEALNAK